MSLKAHETKSSMEAFYIHMVFYMLRIVQETPPKKRDLHIAEVKRNKKKKTKWFLAFPQFSQPEN